MDSEKYEAARAAGKSWIRTHAEDKPFTFTGAALVAGFLIGLIF